MTMLTPFHIYPALDSLCDAADSLFTRAPGMPVEALMAADALAYAATCIEEMCSHRGIEVQALRGERPTAFEAHRITMTTIRALVQVAAGDMPTGALGLIPAQLRACADVMEEEMSKEQK